MKNEFPTHHPDAATFIAFEPRPQHLEIACRAVPAGTVLKFPIVRARTDGGLRNHPPLRWPEADTELSLPSHRTHQSLGLSRLVLRMRRAEGLLDPAIGAELTEIGPKVFS